MNPVVARSAPHYFEEPCISGKNGSGTVFFSGCNLGCVFCQNADISRNIKGKELTPQQLADVFKRLEQEGVHNINLVTPTHFTPQIAKALEIYGGKLPIVWNSSGYELPETLKTLDGLVDIYMPDMKYGDDQLAKKYSFAENYFDVSKVVVEEMYRQRGRYIMDDGMLKSGVLIRHLVLPNAYENTRNVLDYISDRFGDGEVLFSLMGQYTPMPNVSNIPDLARKITESEYNWAVGYMRSCGIEDGFVQEISSAEKFYIPDFDLTGV
ncbi:MAG: radical SAM protein [Clostridia bacterium]|nr:radical SAM protein [Clostridia bacterium]